MDWWNIPPPNPEEAGVGALCARCFHGQHAHDYSDISCNFAQCVVVDCPCDDYEEPLPENENKS